MGRAPIQHRGDDMNPAIEIVVAGVIVPAAVSFAAFWLSRRFLSDEISSRYATAIAFAAAYCVGYLLLPSWAELAPKRHWHWTPYLALAAAVIGPISAASGLHLVERWVLYFVTAFVSAWLLVPTWASLQPPRSVCVPLLAAYLFLLAALLESLLSRLPAVAISAQLTISSVCVAVLIAGFVSVTYARPAGIAAAALAGVCVAAYLTQVAATARGLGLGYAVTVGGWAFIGCIEPHQPALGLLFAPVAPLSLWWCVSGPVSRLHGRTAATVQTVVVLFHLAIAIGLVAMTSAHS
jgi:hypothetical protein